MVRRGLLAAIASALTAAALMAAGAGASEVTGPPLAAPHVGVPVSAPPPALVNGETPDFVLYRWERCRPYSMMVGFDRPTNIWHLSGDVADGAIYGFVNGAQRFDGIDDSMALSAEPDISGTKPYTIELWVRPLRVDDRYRFMISRETTDARGRQGTGIWFSKRGVGFERWTDGVKAGITFTRGIEVGRWVGITATYDGARMRLFVSAFLTGSRATTAPLAPSAAPFRLGTGASKGGNFGFFNGDLDEVALYDRALTRSHIGAHGWAGIGAPCVQLSNDADGPTYTPAVEELGATLKAVVNSTRSYPSGDVTVSSISESLVPADDNNGQFVRPLILRPLEDTVSGTTHLIAAVLGLPMIDRIEFLVDGVVRYAKDEAPYQYEWDTTAVPNGTHTLAVRVWGPGSSTPATAQRIVTVAN